MIFCSIFFWIFSFIIVWAMGGYALSLKVLGKIFSGRRLIKDYSYRPTVTVMIVAHNEEKVILDKLNNVISNDYPKDLIEYIVASDFSTDSTNQIVEKFIEDHPDYKITLYKSREHIITKTKRVNYSNYLRYGTVRIAARLKSLRENAIYFNQYFGGGTNHCHGEDNLFLTACLKNKLKIYAVPEYIAELTEERKSTWNKGYNSKYFLDQGYLYKLISKKWWKLLCLQDAVRHSKRYGITWYKAYKRMTRKIENLNK